MRLIDADELQRDMMDMVASGMYVLEDMIDAVIEAPTIDAVPVVHGEWVEENRNPRSAQFVCSVCHRTAYDIQPTRNKAWRKRCRYAYCPNCGARMDGKENSNDNQQA